MDANLTDLLSQISGLLAFTCGAGILWVFLMVWISRRNAERKRRAQEGLPPLPEVNEIIGNWFRQLMGSKSEPKDTTLPQSVRRGSAAGGSLEDFVPAPDLSMLVSDLPQPALHEYNAGPVSRGEPEPKPKPEPAVAMPPSNAQEKPMPPSPDTPSELPPASPERAAPADSVELLRVWRDMPTGALIIEINGRRFETLSQIRNTDLERRFSNVVRELGTMIQPTRPDSAPVPPRASTRPAAPPLTQEPPSMKPGAMFRQMGRAAMGQAPQPSEEKPALSIADQIEALLQARLVNLPLYSRRTIHVRPSISGGVKIEVDGQFYDGVGDVTDPDVRELLIDVVREWESQQ